MGFLQISELDGLCPLIIRVYVGASTSVTTTRIMWYDKLERLRRQKERTSVLKFAIPRTLAIAHPEINVGELRWVTRSAG